MNWVAKAFYHVHGKHNELMNRNRYNKHLQSSKEKAWAWKGIMLTWLQLKVWTDHIWIGSLKSVTDTCCPLQVSQWIQEEERREFDHQRSQMRERVRAKIEEEQRIVLQQERIEMLERAGEAIKEEERELFDSRHAEMVKRKESGLLVEQPLQVINIDVCTLKILSVVFISHSIAST